MAPATPSKQKGNALTAECCFSRSGRFPLQQKSGGRRPHRRLGRHFLPRDQDNVPGRDNAGCMSKEGGDPPTTYCGNTGLTRPSDSEAGTTVDMPPDHTTLVWKWEEETHWQAGTHTTLMVPYVESVSNTDDYYSPRNEPAEQTPLPTEATTRNATKLHGLAGTYTTLMVSCAKSVSDHIEGPPLGKRGKTHQQRILGKTTHVLPITHEPSLHLQLTYTSHIEGPPLGEKG